MINKYFLAKMNIPAYLKKFLYNRYGYTEIEGIPPIIFKGNGKNLIDYRIDGASGGVGERTSNLFTNVWFQGEINSSTGIMQTSSIFVCSDFIPITPLITYSCSRTVSREYNNLRCYDANKQYVGTGATNANIGNPLNNGVSFGTFMITNESVAYIRFNDKSNDLTTKYMLVEGEYTESTMPSYEPYGYKVPVVVSGKNLFDGIYGANHFSKIEPDKTITISTKSTGESSITFVYKKSDGTRFRYTRLLNENETSGSVTVTTPSEAVGISIYAAADYTSQTIAYDTLIEYGDRATTYEPYHEPITTNIYLDEPIEENESISLSDTNVNIPTIKGTNVLTVDTTVQPSNVYIKVGGG